jgi:replicative DNA helicase
VRRFYREIISSERRIDGEPGVVVEELNTLSKKITEMLTEIEEAKEYDHKQSVYNFMQAVEDGKKKGSAMRGFSSNLPDLDRIISGWERGKVYLVSGLEKIGKSRFVRSMVSHWLRHGLGCVMVMLEEDDAAIHECIFANRCEVDTGTIGTAAITDSGMMRILSEGNAYMQEPLYITTKSSATPNYIKTVINRQKVKMKNAGRELCFVVVDYIQRMGGDGTGHEKYENIASQLADITRDENVCMIQISQVNSAAEKTKGLPLHTQIRFGKVFKEAASCIITFDDPERQAGGVDFDIGRDYKTLNAHIIQRRGLSNVTIGIRSELRYSRFQNFA